MNEQHGMEYSESGRGGGGIITKTSTTYCDGVDVFICVCTVFFVIAAAVVAGVY